MAEPALNLCSLEQLEAIADKLFADYRDYAVLKHTYEFAKQAHIHQDRYFEATPYVAHPLRIIIRMYRDFHIRDLILLQAALLHDVVEDTEIPLAEIKQKFGAKVADYVDKMTRSRDPNETPAEKFVSKRHKFEMYMTASFKLRQLKLFDLIDNMGDWIRIPPENALSRKIPRWLTESELFYLPLAKTIGPRFSKPIEEIMQQFRDKGYKPQYDKFAA